MIDPAARRRNSRRMVFDLIRERQKLSWAQLARETNMSFPTVMKVVDEFIAKGLLRELEEIEPMDGAGRRGHMLKFEPGAYRAIGVECEGHYAHVGMTDMTGSVLVRETIELGDFARTRDLTPLSEAIAGMVRQTGSADVLGGCIGFPANMDPQAGAIVSYSAMGLTQPTPFCEIFPDFCQGLHMPLLVENDVNIACEGEAFLRQQSGQGKDMLYMSLGTGCGGALRMNGKLQRGARCRLGEVGYMLLHPALGAPRRGQPQDTLERAVCLQTLEERFGVRLHDGARLSDETAAALRDYLVPLLSGAIYNLVMTLDLDLCVLAGIIPTLLGPQLHQQISDALCAALPEEAPVCVETAFSQDAGIIGAAATVFSRQLDAVLER